MRKINYPLIVSDFDGTLVNGDGTISEFNRKMIAEYVSAGGAFAVSTGRMPLAILSRVRELGLKGMVSCCQGAVILDIESGDVVSQGTLSLETTVSVCEKMESLGLHYQVYDLWDYYSNMDNESLRYYENVVKSKAKLVLDRPLSVFVREQGLCAYKILAIVKPEDNARIMRELEEANLQGCEVTKSADILVEVINDQYSKGTAVRFLADYYNVPIEKTVAVGDQRNDLPMIEAAGLGVAVQNADESLKAKADYVSRYTNTESAVGKLIEKFGYEEREN